MQRCAAAIEQALRHYRSNRISWPCILISTVIILPYQSAASAAPMPRSTAFHELSLQQLSEIEVTSVSKQSEKLLDAPASIFVITNDDIRRSGVTSIPEALRLAPGVEVARINAHQWAISIRGFNSDITNKLLVLIDGRSVYSPLYAGVFWDAQDTLLDDIDRIEVISGPGGTLWGANAVNGVINIITRSAQDTQGGLVEIGGGNEKQRFGSARYGGHLGDAAVRAYIKGSDSDASQQIDGDAGTDDWRMAQGGFRLDWQPTTADRLTVQGDMYHGSEDGVFQQEFTLGSLPGGTIDDEVDLEGGNLLARWTRQLGTTSDFALQIYYDYTLRDIPNIYQEKRDTGDLDFQHHIALGSRNDVLWGVGYRWTSDRIDNTPFASFIPDSRNDETFSAFVQDKIDLWQKRVFLTLGSKFEHNDYSGFEYQPNARLSWLISDKQSAWGAVSRAVRIPARLDTDLQLVIPVGAAPLPTTPPTSIPLYITVDGNKRIESEELIAYEAGYRVQIAEAVSMDLATFYNEYDHIQTAETGEPVVVVNPPMYAALPKILENGIEGKAYGGTLLMNWRPLSDWRLRFQYALFDMNLDNKPGSNDVDSKNEEDNSPHNQYAIYSFLDLPYQLSLYTGVRYVDGLKNLDNDHYTAVDVSLIWNPINQLQLSVTAQDVNNPTHLEFGPAQSQEVERSIYGKVQWRF
jgi:iron complex outermembrane recepter protein